MFADKFKKREYPSRDMASILKATAIVGDRAQKPSSGSAKEVNSKVEHLSNGQIDKGFEEEASHTSAGGKKDKRNGKVFEDPHKRRKLTHSSNSSTAKFRTAMSHSNKADPLLPKLMNSAMKAVKVEMVRKAEQEEAVKEVVEVSKTPKKAPPARTVGNVGRFLRGQDEVIALTVLEMLSTEVQSATENFYKFWINRWQTHGHM